MTSFPEYQNQTMKSWPPELRAAVLAKLAEHDKYGSGYEYMDNYRYARVGNATEEAAFEKAERSGCCGSFTEEITVNATTAKLGFNHGH